MADTRINLPNPLHVQEEKLRAIQQTHVTRLQEGGILQKAQRAYMAEYMPLPSGGGSAGVDISESLSAEQFTVGHDINGDIEHILIVQAQYHPILVGTITKSLGGEPAIEPNQKRGFNVLDVKSVASMVQELASLKQSGELLDLTDDLQRIEKQPAKEPKTVTQQATKTTPDNPIPQAAATIINLEEAIRLLSYGDVLPKQHQADAVDAIRKGETTLEYAKELVNLYAVHGKEAVEELANGMVNYCACVLKDKNITPSIYAPSISWALWDIAKQSYLAKHPGKSLAEYVESLEDPFALTSKGDQKRIEIRERHIGWEVMRRWDQGEVRAADLPAEAQQILTSGKRNETSQLRSYELAALGHVVAGSTSINAC